MAPEKSQPASTYLHLFIRNHEDPLMVKVTEENEKTHIWKQTMHNF